MRSSLKNWSVPDRMAQVAMASITATRGRTRLQARSPSCSCDACHRHLCREICDNIESMYIRESLIQEAALPLLTSWGNFYVIIGSAAAALTGLMFVVVTLIAGSRVERSSGTIGAFGTPTVVHFCAALLIAAILSAPWEALWHVSLV